MCAPCVLQQAHPQKRGGPNKKKRAKKRRSRADDGDSSEEEEEEEEEEETGGGTCVHYQLEACAACVAVCVVGCSGRCVFG